MVTAADGWAADPLPLAALLLLFELPQPGVNARRHSNAKPAARFQRFISIAVDVRDNSR